MIFYIDGKRQPENLFWNSIQGIASETQIYRLLEGIPLIIGQTKYLIEFIDEEE